MNIKIKKLHENAIIPTRANPTDAGLDLYSIDNDLNLVDVNNVTLINSYDIITVKTGIAIEIPEGYYGRIAPKSGLAVNFGVDVLAGVIDSSYRGEIKVVLVSHKKNNTGWQFLKGKKIAQLIIEKHYNFPIEIVDELSDTDRGTNGFGSTGI